MEQERETPQAKQFIPHEFERHPVLLFVTKEGDVIGPEHEQAVTHLRDLGFRVVGVRCTPAANTPAVSVLPLDRL